MQSNSSQPHSGIESIVSQLLTAKSYGALVGAPCVVKGFEPSDGRDDVRSLTPNATNQRPRKVADSDSFTCESCNTCT